MNDPGRRNRPAAGDTVLLERALRLSGPGRDPRAGLLTLTTSIVVASAALVACQQLAPRPASPSPRATPPLVVTYESQALGYRIQLPAGFRRSDCLSAWASGDARFGKDVFTQLTPDQERAQDRGHVAFGGPVAWQTIWVAVSNADGRSVLEWAREYGSFGGIERHEPVVIDGHEATRTVVRDTAQLYVVRADDRMYLISEPPESLLPDGLFDAVARTFRPGAGGPIPTPTPHPELAPVAAREAATRIAAALEAGDVGRLAALITPRCWLEIWIPQAGTSGRAVDAYVAELRTRFQSGGLRVKVEPTVQVAPQPGPGGLRLFVPSDWTESGRTTPIDLFLREIDGEWYWAGAQFRPRER